MGLFEFVTEELVDEEAAIAATKPVWADLAKVWKQSWRRWHKLSEDNRRRLLETPTARPVMLNAFAQSFAIERFSGRESEGLVVCDALPHVFAFYIDDRILIRFNGLNNGHIVHLDASHSQLKRDYFSQEPIRKINNDATRLTVGYTLDALRTDMASIEVSCQVGNDLVYHFPIDGRDKVSLPLPTPKEPPTPKMPNAALTKKNPK
ncbi:MAG: hypothetical protein AB7G28_02375 [Pirellulales bacterium]